MGEMGRYTPFWSGILESSLWDEEDLVVKVFLTMWGLQDGDHVVRRDEYRIAFYSRKTQGEVARALKVLASPDKHRPGQEHDGRRIKKVADGWLILNGEKYQKAMVEANRRAYMRRYMAERRARGKGLPLPGEKEYEEAIGRGASEAELAAIEAKYDTNKPESTPSV